MSVSRLPGRGSRFSTNLPKAPFPTGLLKPQQRHLCLKRKKIKKTRRKDNIYLILEAEKQMGEWKLTWQF